MKKALALILAIIMVLSLAACGNTDSDTPGNSDDASDGDKYTAEKPLIFKLGHDSINDSAPQRGALAFKEYVEKESDNRIKVELYPNAELGSAAQMLDLVAMGSLSMACVEASELGPHNERLSFLSLPFLFESYDEAVELVYTPGAPLYELFQEEANKVNFHTLGFQFFGLRSVSNNVREINVADDLKGLKMRVMQTPTAIATFTALETNVTPLAFAEVYTGLQQKLVDGQDNPPTLTYEMKFNEVQKYYSTTEHMVAFGVNAVNHEWFKSLPEDFQEIIAYASEEFNAKQQRIETREEEVEALEAIADSGTKVTIITDKSTFIEKTKPVYDTLAESYGQDFMDKVLEAIGRQ